MRVGFASGHVLLSKIIKKLTHSQASHSYIVFNAAGHELVIQATVNGVCCEHYEVFKKKTTIVAEYELKLTPEQEFAGLDYALKRLLQPYDFLGIVGFLWVIINKRLGRKIDQPFKNSRAFFCSELVTSSIQVAQLTLSHQLDPDTTSPEDIIEFLDNHPQATLVYGQHNQ